MDLIARHYQTGGWVRITIAGTMITEVTPVEGPAAPTGDDEWVAPAFWDIQVNGRWGVSFSDPDLTVDRVAAIVRAQGALGTARLCPTLISAPTSHLHHGLATIAATCADDPDVE